MVALLGDVEGGKRTASVVSTVEVLGLPRAFGAPICLTLPARLRHRTEELRFFGRTSRNGMLTSNFDPNLDLN